MYLDIPENLKFKHDKPVNHNLRKNADDTLEVLLKCAIGLSMAKPEDLILSCLNCDFFIEATEICKKYNQHPPARVIAFACPSHENINDEIPF